MITKEALACQLLTGSYRGATRSCSCHGSRDCFFAEKARETLIERPEIQERRKENLNEYNESLSK